MILKIGLAQLISPLNMTNQPVSLWNFDIAMENNHDRKICGPLSVLNYQRADDRKAVPHCQETAHIAFSQRIRTESLEESPGISLPQLGEVMRLVRVPNRCKTNGLEPVNTC